MDDLYALNTEMKSSILRKYLDEDDYSQNLISRQEEIDGVLINYVQNEWKKKIEEREERKEREESVERNRLSNHPVIKIAKLYNLRKRIGLVTTSTSTFTPPSKTIKPPYLIFRDILQKSKQMVFDWDGKMYFVYLVYHQF